MKICIIIIILSFACFYCKALSHAPKQCDITLWHMSLLEHLLTQETDMTQQQKSILVRVEQIIERIVKDGGAPLVNCALLNAYGYKLAPDVSSKLMELSVSESDQSVDVDINSSNNLPVHKAKADRDEKVKIIENGIDKGDDTGGVDTCVDNDGLGTKIDTYRLDSVGLDKNSDKDGLHENINKDGLHKNSDKVDLHKNSNVDSLSNNSNKGGLYKNKDKDRTHKNNKKDRLDKSGEDDRMDTSNSEDGLHSNSEDDSMDTSNSKDGLHTNSEEDKIEINDATKRLDDRDIPDVSGASGILDYPDEISGYHDDGLESNDDDQEDDDCYYSAGEFICRQNIREASSDHETTSSNSNFMYINDGDPDDKTVNDDIDNSSDVHEGNTDSDDTYIRDVGKDIANDGGDIDNSDIHENKIDDGDKDSSDVHDHNTDGTNSDMSDVHEDNIDDGDTRSRNVDDDNTDDGSTRSNDVHDDTTDDGDTRSWKVREDTIDDGDTSSRYVHDDNTDGGSTRSREVRDGNTKDGNKSSRDVHGDNTDDVNTHSRNVHDDNIENYDKDGYDMDDHSNDNDYKQRKDTHHVTNNSDGNDIIIDKRDTQSNDVEGDTNIQNVSGGTKNRDDDADTTSRDVDGDLNNRAVDDDIESREVDDDIKSREVDDDIKSREVDDDIKSREVDDDIKSREVDDDIKSREVDDDIKSREVDDDIKSREVDDDIKSREVDDGTNIHHAIEESSDKEGLDNSNLYDISKQEWIPSKDREKRDNIFVDNDSSDHPEERTRSTEGKDDEDEVRDENHHFIRSSKSTSENDYKDATTTLNSNNGINALRNDQSGGVVIFYAEEDDIEEELNHPQNDGSLPYHKMIYEDSADRKQTVQGDAVDSDRSVIPESGDYLDKDIDNVVNNDDNVRDNQENINIKQKIDFNSRKYIQSEFQDSHFDEPNVDNKRNTISTRNEEDDYSKEYIKLSEQNDKDINFRKKNYKHDDTANENMNEKINDIKRQSLHEQTVPDLVDSSGHSKLEMEKIKRMFAQRESEHTTQIQNLELKLVKLENTILSQSVNRERDSSAFINLENQMLKLENEFMKLSLSYRQLEEDHNALKAQQRKSYLELEHFKTIPNKSEFPALSDNSSNEIMVQQQTRIMELSSLIQNQSDIAKKLQDKSAYLEDQNQKLFHVMMNQTALIASIMSKLDELGEDGLHARTQVEEYKLKLDKLRQTKVFQQPMLNEDAKNQQIFLQQAADIFDFAIDSSVKTHSALIVTDLVSIILSKVIAPPTAGSSVLKSQPTWRCDGQNSPRLCIFNALIISNCTPFNDIQWTSCKNTPDSLILETTNENEYMRDDVSSYNLNLSLQEQIPTAKPYESEIPDGSKKHTQHKESKYMAAKRNKEYKNKETRLVASVTTKTQPEGVGENYDFGAKADREITAKHRYESDASLTVITKPANVQDEQSDDEDLILPRMSNSLSEQHENMYHNDETIDPENKNEGDENTSNVDNVDDTNIDKIKSIVVLENSRDGDLSEKEDGYILEQKKGGISETEQMLVSAINETKESASCEYDGQSPKLENRKKLYSPICESSTLNQQIGASSERLDTHQESNVNDRNKHEPNLKHGTDDIKTAEDKFVNKKMTKHNEEDDESTKMHEALNRKGMNNQAHKGRPKDCYELYQQGHTLNGVSRIFVSGMNMYVSVYCDMTNGGWTQLLKREDGIVDFYRDYKQYKEGFGVPRGEHYIGNEVIHHITNQERYTLKTELSDWDGTTKHAYYDHFWVEGEDDGFLVHFLGYSGDAGDGLGKHNGMKFSTFDVDHDLLKAEMGGSCAKRFHGAGWYYKCYSSNIFGRYYTGGEIPDKRFDGVAWKPWTGPGYSLKTVVLSIRPFDADI